MNRTKNSFLLVSIILILTFLWRAFTPSHEYPGPTKTLMDIGFDLLFLIGVIGCWSQLPQGFRGNAGSRVLCVAAVIAGISLFAIRFHNNDSWNTGHWTYYIESR